MFFIYRNIRTEVASVYVYDSIRQSVPNIVMARADVPYNNIIYSSVIRYMSSKI